MPKGWRECIQVRCDVYGRRKAAVRLWSASCQRLLCEAWSRRSTVLHLSLRAWEADDQCLSLWMACVSHHAYVCASSGMEAELHALRDLLKELETASAEADKKLDAALAGEQTSSEARDAAASAAKGLADAEEQACAATCFGHATSYKAHSNHL